MQRRRIAAAAVWAWLAGATAASAACPSAALTPPGETARSQAAAKPIDADALVALRDIKGFAPSPDGRLVFAVTQRANPAAHSYDTRWIVLDADCAGSPREVDAVGRVVLYRVYSQPNGYATIEAPTWAPGGRWVAYRKEVEDRVELWVADVEREQAWRADIGDADVARFAWSDAGVLLYATDLNRARFHALLETERRRGFLYDARFHPASGETQPMKPACAYQPRSPACEDQLHAVDVTTAGMAPPRPPTADERAVWDVKLKPAAGVASAAILSHRNAVGEVVWAENLDPTRFKGSSPLLALKSSAADVRPCRDAACSGAFDGLWWDGAGRAVVFVRRESGARRDDHRPLDITGLYRWDRRTGRVANLVRTSDAVDECEVAAAHLYCLLETPRAPARLVRVEIRSGKAEVVYDPNPDVRAGSDLSIEKRHYTDELGNPGFVYLVRKRGLGPSERRPVVVVQYRARGFLRGGTGDEYPIFPMAERGFIVLVFDKANTSRALVGLQPVSQMVQDRAAAVHAIDRVLDDLIAAGEADPARIAITGLSSGAEILHYALQRSDRYAAAIASSGPVELDFLVLTTPVLRDYKAAYGARRVLDRDTILSELAWGAQPEKLKTPLLVNVTDGEFFLGLEGFAALRDLHRPVEVRVFTDPAKHIKYDPANRQAIYRLNLEWLSFWLQDRKPEDPALADQFARWEAMRSQVIAERRTRTEESPASAR